MLTTGRRFLAVPIIALALSAWGSAAHAQSAAAATNPLDLQVHHITATATDVDRAVKWYQDMLGFHLDQRTARGNTQIAELSIPGFGVAFVQQAAAAATAAAPPVPAGRNRWVHIVFAVSDPGRTFELLKAKGANPRTRTPAGQPVVTFLVDDSEGNEIEFVQRAPVSRQNP
jgi:catechol 2,3-dioxygenase-like lactoylglutathione lyase family enzyme